MIVDRPTFSLPLRRRIDGGFTTLELIVTLLIIGILAAIAIPRASNDPILLSTQAEQLANDIRYVQSLAMTQGQRYRLNFVSASAYSFTTAGGVAVPHPLSGATAPVNLGANVRATLPPGNLPNGLVGFDGRGIPYTDAPVRTALSATATITLSVNAATRAVTITPETGLVRVP